MDSREAIVKATYLLEMQKQKLLQDLSTQEEDKEEKVEEDLFPTAYAAIDQFMLEFVGTGIEGLVGIDRVRLNFILKNFGGTV